jgi:hypothetical protein
MKKVAFYSPHLGLRGTEITMYDFADYNEKILGNKSIIIYNIGHPFTHPEVVKKFKDRFDTVYELERSGPNDWHWNGSVTMPMLDPILEKEGCYGFYVQKFGNNDGLISRVCKTLILVAAPVCEPHGDVYAYVSEWLSEKASGGRYPSVPSMITPLPPADSNMREELGIPESATVFGRTGGYDTWSIPWASEIVKNVVHNNTNAYFVFQNTEKFYDHPQIKWLGASADLHTKSRFIETCDAMIHARNEGESFGCACGEFALKNKPIITWSGSSDRNHIRLIGDRGYLYNDPSTLYNILMNFEKRPDKDWNVYSNYNPETTMRKFNEIFLEGK